MKHFPPGASWPGALLIMGVGAVAYAVTASDTPEPGGGVHAAAGPSYQPGDNELKFVGLTACNPVSTPSMAPAGARSERLPPQPPSRGNRLANPVDATPGSRRARVESSSKNASLAGASG